MAAFVNSHRGHGLPRLWDGAPVLPSVDAGAVASLLAECPAHAPTPLVGAPALAEAAGVAEVWLKDERTRMGLGSFKALGAAYVIARDAVAAGGDPTRALAGRVYVAASAGNHGLSVATGARVFGAKAVIVLAETVPESFAERLRDKGAEVMRAGAVYEDSMAAVQAAAAREGWVLLSDSSWPGYTDLPFRVMEGYLQLAAEAQVQMPAPPSHIFVQAGVGGMAASVAAHARHVWGDAPRIVVVEPEAAPCLLESARSGRLVTVEGPVSAMGRLDCKEPSLIALAGLARDADVFLTVSEAAAERAVAALAAQGIGTTPSGAAGVAGLLSGAAALELGAEARALCIVSEAA